MGHGLAPLQADPCPTLTRTPPPVGKMQVLSGDNGRERKRVGSAHDRALLGLEQGLPRHCA